MVAFQIPKVVPPEETPIISKQVQAIRKKEKKKKKRASSSSLMKSKDITKSVHTSGPHKRKISINSRSNSPAVREPLERRRLVAIHHPSTKA
jgi:hypothetical protein